MKLRYEKNVRVLTDLLGYCHFIGSNNLSTNLLLEPTRSVIEVRCQVRELDPARVDELNKYLHIPRQHEVEQYYWNISGEEEIDSELSLAGMMVDTAEITYDGEELRIVCERLDETSEE